LQIYKGALFVISAAMLWGTTGTLQALMPVSRDPLVVATLRVIIASIALALFLVVKKKFMPTKYSFRLTKGSFAVLFIAGISIAVYNMAFFSGVSRAGVAMGTAFALGTGPIWVSALYLIIGGVLPPWKIVLGQALAIGGLFVMLDVGQISDDAALGIFFSTIAGLFYAIFSISTRHLSLTYSPFITTSGTFIFASLLMSPILISRNLTWIDYNTLYLLGILGILSTAVAFVLFSQGLSLMKPPIALSLAFAEPLTAWLLAIFIIGETATQVQIFGGFLLLAGLLVVLLNQRDSYEAI